MKTLALTFLIAFGAVAHADNAAPRVLVAQADTGSAAPATPAAAPTPADKLHDPLSAPGASWDDLKAAKKVGWPLAVFAGLIMLCKLLARAKSVSFLAALGKGKTAVVIGALGALGAACFNAAAEGGAWTALLVAGVTAIGHYLDAGEKE